MAQQGIEYHIRAILEAKKASGSLTQLAGFAAGLRTHADAVASAGSRLVAQAGGMAAKVASIAAPLTGALSLGALGAGITTAVQANARLENSQFGMASTLQLMNRNAGDFATNMAEAQYVTDELFKRAATSPASFEQAQEMFRNVLPGAIQLTQDMERILDMGESALTLGIQMGGDFRQAGADLRRILTGQAGADVRAWVEGLRTPIEELAHTKYGLKKFGKDFVAEFNTMDPQKRFQLVEEAVSRLAPATAYAGTMWAGLTSTVEANLQFLHRAMGQNAFETIKDNLKGIVAQGGVLDPKGETMAKLESAARFLGDKIGKGVAVLIKWAVDGIAWAADNWQTVVIRMGEVWDKGLRVAKLMLAAKVAQGAAGVGASVVGGAGGLLGKGMGMAGQLADAIRGIGVSGLFALPILLVAGAAVAGLGVAFGGVVAYFVEHWEKIVQGFKDGAITLVPLLDLVDLLWAKMLAVGQVFVGAVDPVSGVARGVSLMESGMYGLMGAMSLAMRVMGWVQFGFNVITAGILGVYLGLVSLVQGIMWLVKEAVGLIPEGARSAMGLDAIDSAYQSIADHADGIGASLKEDAREALSENKFFAAADAFDAAYVTGQGVTAGLREELAGWQAGKEGAGGVQGKGGAMAAQAPNRPDGKTTIHKLIINQDLRGADPDRVIGAFYRGLDKATRQKTQATTGLQGGS